MFKFFLCIFVFNYSKFPNFLFLIPSRSSLRLNVKQVKLSALKSVVTWRQAHCLQNIKSRAAAFSEWMARCFGAVALVHAWRNFPAVEWSPWSYWLQSGMWRDFFALCFLYTFDDEWVYVHNAWFVMVRYKFVPHKSNHSRSLCGGIQMTLRKSTNHASHQPAQRRKMKTVKIQNSRHTTRWSLL